MKQKMFLRKSSVNVGSTKSLINWHIRIRQITVFFLAALLFFPYIVQAVANPVGSYSQTDNGRAEAILVSVGIRDAQVKFITVKNLTIMGTATRGYVNLFASQDIVYLRPFADKSQFYGSKSFYKAIVLHEYGHILQKRTINKMTSNPYEKYQKLLALNDILAIDAPTPITPKGKPSTLTFQGLETDADCISVALSNVIVASYIDAARGCNVRSTALARIIREGEFPTPLLLSHYENTEAQKRKEDLKEKKEEASTSEGRFRS